MPVPKVRSRTMVESPAVAEDNSKINYSKSSIILDETQKVIPVG